MGKDKFIKGIKVVLFLAIFAYMFVHISYMVRPEIAHTRGNLSGYYAEEKDSLDVVFIGTSCTFAAFAPMIAWEEYGFTSYNLCTNGMAVETMPYAVKESVKSQNPAVLVIDIYPFAIKHSMKKWTETEWRYNADGWKYSLNRCALIRKELPDKLDKLSYYLDFIKYHSNQFNWDNFLNEMHSVTKGYNALPWGEASPAELTDEKIPLDSDYVQTLDSLLDLCKTIDTKVMFICYPYGKVQDFNIGNINYIQDKIEKEGFFFLNCELVREEFQLDYAVDFWDGGHFNIYGAEKVTKYIGNYLKKAYSLQDKRKDDRYSEWNKDMETWREIVTTAKKSIDEQKAEANTVN